MTRRVLDKTLIHRLVMFKAELGNWKTSLLILTFFVASFTRELPLQLWSVYFPTLS